jgi:endonuclease/exonuclease/phosphatase family metal-dependent hydrolase
VTHEVLGLSGVALPRRAAALRDGGGEAPCNPLRVVTLNVWAHGGDWPARRAVLRDGFARLQPDLVALQETIKTASYDQAADILGEDFHIVHQTQRDADGMGVSIASSWPILQVRELDLRIVPRAQADPFPCTTLAIEVRAPEPAGRLLFVNHFPSWQLDFEHEREQQAVAAARFIDALGGGRNLHVVLAGDLDADPDASSIRFWTGRHALDGVSVCYRDAWESAHLDEPGHTFTPRNALVPEPDWPFRRIDYVLVRCAEHGGPALAIDDCRIVLGAPVDGVQASDHYGVLADLRRRDP